MKKLMLLFATSIIFLSYFFSLNIINGATYNIDGPDIIHKEMNQVFTIIDLLKLYDDDVLIDNDNFTGSGNVPGKYIITIRQGTITKDIEINVIEKWGNLIDSNDILFVADKSDIYVSNERKLTVYEIIYYIYGNTGLIDVNYDFVYEENTNEYHTSFIDGEILPGAYDFIFRLTYYSGNQATYNASIIVVELPELSGVILEPPPTTIDKIIKGAPFIIIIALIIYLISKKTKKRGYNV
jgi:hypothetical protein